MATRSQERGHPKRWRTPFPLPVHTTSFVNRHRNSSDNQNLGLWLERFVSWQDETKKKAGWIDTELRRHSNSDHREVPMLKLNRGSGLLHWQGDDELWQYLERRWRRILEGYSYHRDLPAAPAWRFVVGLGGASVLETGMTLHRLYGLPIIPGSALKGLAHAYAETVEANSSEVVAIFGKPPRSTPLKSGEIIFFDAIPVSRPRFKLDVMTSHFQNYYQGNDPPADWQDPNPIYFLTVQDTQFLFAVAARREEGEQYVDTALGWLKKGLAELGIGAKTAAGYGYFEEVK
jgi:CRISPR-associated protein Cmr6